MGMAGCDNAIAKGLGAAGYSVYNPAYDIKSFHLHNSCVRDNLRVDPDRIVAQPYRLIQPGHLDNRCIFKNILKYQTCLLLFIIPNMRKT